MSNVKALAVYCLFALTANCQHSVDDGAERRPKTSGEQVPFRNPTPLLFGAGPFTGNATHFDGLGVPAGGCGIPQDKLETQNFVALNVQNTPGNYSVNFPRPIVVEQSSVVGAFDNGRNCGRWLQVTIGDYCTGNNDGAPNSGFCHDAKGVPWVSDRFNGATLAMLVADSCQDGNAWCRDDPYHLDLSIAALTQFKKGSEEAIELPQHWGNRQVTWTYIPAPNYNGDIEIALARNAQALWLPIIVSRLENGIHGVEALVEGQWRAAKMVADNGQVYELPAGVKAPYKIRVYDTADQLINNGRIYSFNFPAECGTTCSSPYTPVSYTIE
jgi:hypothetical protein